MNKQIELLIKIQGLDTRIIEKSTHVASMPARLSSEEKPLKSAEASLLSEKQRIQALEKKKKDKEREVEEIVDKVAKLKSRTSEIKTNKEYQAHLKEIESKEKEKLSSEDSILALMEELDSLAGKIKTAESAVAGEKKKVEELKAVLDKEVTEEQKELEALRASRSALMNEIDPDVYGEYMRLLDVLRGLAVCEVKGEICQGCNMNIPPQLFVEIKKNEEIMQCPQCKRIIYYKPEEPALS